jgi:hypothetical protein
MHVAAVWLVVPSCVALLAIWRWTRRKGLHAVADALAVGTVGGLLGTVGYDLVRIPFELAGQRVFAPISVFGVWLFDARASSRFTEVAGWAYHYLNGLTFGVMYALVMRGRHWAWAVGWAFLLETLAVVSPFGRVFALSGNYPAIAIAYLGHVAYGVPLGWTVQRFDGVNRFLGNLPAWSRWAAVALAAAALLGPLASPDAARRDTRARPDEFRVEGRELNPGWLRLTGGLTIGVYNPGPGPVSVRVKRSEQVLRLSADERGTLSFRNAGIYQLFVETDLRSRSSFVIVEPVERAP